MNKVKNEKQMTKDEIIEAIIIMLHKCKSTKALEEILYFVVNRAQ